MIVVTKVLQIRPKTGVICIYTYSKAIVGLGKKLACRRSARCGHPLAPRMCVYNYVGNTRGCVGDTHSQPESVDRAFVTPANKLESIRGTNKCMFPCTVYSLSTLYGENLSFVGTLTCNLYVYVLMLYIQTRIEFDTFYYLGTAFE